MTTPELRPLAATDLLTVEHLLDLSGLADGDSLGQQQVLQQPQPLTHLRHRQLEVLPRRLRAPPAHAGGGGGGGGGGVADGGGGGGSGGGQRRGHG